MVEKILMSEQEQVNTTCRYPFPPLDIDRNLGHYTKRIGTLNRISYIICLPMKELDKRVKASKEGNLNTLSEEHWNYFLLSINEHPLYQVRNRKEIVLKDFYALAEVFWKEHGEERFETLLCWSLWLIQRDLHPLYYLIPRQYPVVRNYEEAQLFNGLPATAYVESDSLKRILEKNQAKLERLMYLQSIGKGDSPEAKGLENVLKKKNPNQYIYGNWFDDLSLYINADFLEPKTLLLGQFIGIRDWFDYDYGTVDRIVKAKSYQKKHKKTALYLDVVESGSSLKFFAQDLPGARDAKLIERDNRYLVNLFDIRSGSKLTHGFDSKTGKKVQPTNKFSEDRDLDISKLPMSQAKLQAELIHTGSYANTQDEDWDDDYFNTKKYWDDQSDTPDENE